MRQRLTKYQISHITYMYINIVESNCKSILRNRTYTLNSINETHYFDKQSLYIWKGLKQLSINTHISKVDKTCLYKYIVYDNIVQDNKSSSRYSTARL